MLDIAKTVETVISVVGFVLGTTYLIGGLIVNLHLSLYGITQYQVLRIKYLVVGLTYLTNFTAILILATIPALYVGTLNFFVQQVFLIASLLASVCLLWLWGKPTNTKSVLFSWRFWVAVGAISSIFPLMVVIRLGLVIALVGQIGYDVIISIAQGVLTGVLFFVGQTYYYARHLYGRPSLIFGSVDPIGMGIPVHVQLTGESEKISLLTHLGIRMQQPETTDKVLLLDETDTHYIVGISRQANVEAVEIAKDIVTAIRYC